VIALEAAGALMLVAAAVKALLGDVPPDDA
jgi:hypothetical protein